MLVYTFCRAAAADAAAAAPAAAGANSSSKKRTPEDTSYDALSYLLTSLRTFYMGTAKAIHTPVRRREEPTAPPSVPMKAAALNLALLLVGNLQLRPWEGGAAADAGSSAAQQQPDAAVAAVRGRSGHYLRLAEELSQVLFDSRRHYCHLLVLNYFSALGGMQVRCSGAAAAREGVRPGVCSHMCGGQGAAGVSRCEVECPSCGVVPAKAALYQR
jgi:hypothetical protein